MGNQCKSLFNAKDELIPDAEKLIREAGNMLTPLIKKYVAKGYSVRNVAYLLSATVTDIEANILAGWIEHLE